jgi:hypothetical protein
MSINPWVQSPERTAESGADELATTAAPAAPVLSAAPALSPQAASVVAPREHLPRCSIDVPRGTVALWWVGTHGGAGESTLEQLLEGSRAMGHAWPHSDERTTELPHVVLVARTSARGLRSAQLAAMEWASGDVPVHLVGLVLIADAPGRLPKPLKDFAQVVAGGVPHVWRIPWVEEWRLGDPVSADTAPKALTAMLDELRSSDFTIPIP